LRLISAAPHSSLGSGAAEIAGVAAFKFKKSWGCPDFNFRNPGGQAEIQLTFEEKLQQEILGVAGNNS
jgi:hypothetical protein